MNKPKYNVKLFPKQHLQAMLYSTCGELPTEYDVVEDEIVTHVTRWFVNYQFVFRYQEKLYIVDYERNVGGGQESKIFDEYPDEIECYEAEEYMQPAYRKVNVNV